MSNERERALEAARRRGIEDAIEAVCSWTANEHQDDIDLLSLTRAIRARALLASSPPPSRETRKALEEIRDHWACSYDHKYANTEAYRGPYGIGIVDGHRAAAAIARAALDASRTEEKS